jgi:hypothetical protein
MWLAHSTSVPNWALVILAILAWVACVLGFLSGYAAWCNYRIARLAVRAEVLRERISAGESPPRW